jgi:hypothetical protein
MMPLFAGPAVMERMIATAIEVHSLARGGLSSLSRDSGSARHSLVLNVVPTIEVTAIQRSLLLLPRSLFSSPGSRRPATAAFSGGMTGPGARAMTGRDGQVALGLAIEPRTADSRCYHASAIGRHCNDLCDAPEMRDRRMSRGRFHFGTSVPKDLQSFQKPFPIVVSNFGLNQTDSTR